MSDKNFPEIYNTVTESKQKILTKHGETYQNAVFLASVFLSQAEALLEKFLGHEKAALVFYASADRMATKMVSENEKH